ncbi:MAG: O-antigen ligase family protein [bacterium]|nr:O-antigen ligase family protein [bacterium]
MKKSKQGKTKQIEIAVFIEKIVFIYTMGLICGLPLIVHQRYIDILRTKGNYFLGITVTMILLVVLIGIAYWVISGLRLHRSVLLNMRKSMSYTDYFVLLFAIVCTISFILNGNKSATFWGSNGRRVGYGVLAACVVMYFIVSRYFIYHQAVMSGILLSGAGVILVAVLNHLGWDPLHMFVEMTRDSKRITTIGNRNTFASYLSLFAAVVMTAFVINKERLSKILYGSSCLLAFMGAVASNSESIVLVLAVITWVLLYYVVSKKEEMKQFFILVILFGIAMKAMKILRMIRELDCWKLDGAFKYLVDGKAAYYFIIVGAVGLIVCKRRKTEVSDNRVIRVWRRWFLLTTVVGTIGIIAVSIWGTFHFSKQEAKEVLGAGYKYLYLEDAWGSNRIRVWKVASRTFEKMELQQKIVGYGPAGFYYAVKELLPAAEYTFTQGVVMDAHNEALQMLVTLGAIGMISYFGIFLSALGSWIKSSKEQDSTKSVWLYVMVVIAFLVQGILNNPNIVILPLLFMTIGIGEAEKRRKKMKNTKIRRF